METFSFRPPTNKTPIPLGDYLRRNGETTNPEISITTTRPTNRGKPEANLMALAMEAAFWSDSD